MKRIAKQLYNHYFPSGGDHALVTCQDFVGYGMIGLFDAKKKYKDAMAVPFLSYAGFRIRGEIISQMRKQFGLVPIPAEKRRKVKQLSAARKELEAKGITPDTQALAQALGWKVKQVLEVENLKVNIHSIDAECPGQASVQLAAETDTEKAILNRELADTIQQCLEAIGDNEQRMAFIMKHRLDKTLSQIAGHFGFAIQTAANRIEAARMSMANCLGKNGWSLKTGD